MIFSLEGYYLIFTETGCFIVFTRKIYYIKKNFKNAKKKIRKKIILNFKKKKLLIFI